MDKVTTGKKGAQPNVIYIVFDDTGFSDFGCYGSEIKTPNIDELAEGGLRYNQFNVTPLCSPTRASLLTGRYAHSLGMGSIADLDLGEEYPHTRGRITPKAATLAEILQENGFNTYAVGKWHLAPSQETTSAGPYNNWPLSKGFQRFYGFLAGATDQYAPDLFYDNHRIDPPNKPDYHLSEDLVDHSIQFLTDHMSVYPDKPFFMNLAFGAQHEPHQVFKEYIDEYSGVYDKGWDEIRQERFQRQKELGIIPDLTELPPLNPGVQEWSSLTEEEKKLFARFQETYAGFLTHTDEQIGRLLDYLESVNELDNTLIVLLADNGANHQGRLNGATNSMTFFNNIEEQSVEEMSKQIDDIGGPKVEANYPLGWAQTSNTPLKYYKTHTHHGGIRVPLIMHWPEEIVKKGEVRTQYHHVADITATVLDILNIQAPKTHKGIKQLPIHGVSMLNTFDNSEAETNRNTQYYLMQGNRGIWNDGWKAVTLHELGKDYEKDQWELYHVDEDFSEVFDLANDYPEKLEELQQLWWQEADKYGALPLVNTGVVGSMTKGAAQGTFIFYQGMQHLPNASAPNIINKSFSITVPIDRQSESDEGVLVAHGYHGSGYTLYIHNNELIFEYNYVGTIYTIKADKTIPVGKQELKFVFEKTGVNKGNGYLYYGNNCVGEGFIPNTMPLRLSREGLDIGRDGRAPVSPHYPENKEFVFSGEIEKVLISLNGEDGS